MHLYLLAARCAFPVSAASAECHALLCIWSSENLDTLPLQVWLPPYLRDGPQHLADQLNSVAKSGLNSSQCQELREHFDASHGKGGIKLLEGQLEPGTQQTQDSPERRQQSRQPQHEEASYASLSICNVASSAAVDAAPMGRSSPSAHAGSTPSGWKPQAKNSREVGVHGSAFLSFTDGTEELLQSATEVQQPVQPPSISNRSSAPGQSGVLDIDVVPDSEPESESATSVSQPPGGLFSSQAGACILGIDRPQSYKKRQKFSTMCAVSLLIGPSHTDESEVAGVHNGRKLPLPVLRRHRHMGFNAAAKAPTPVPEHLISGTCLK